MRSQAFNKPPKQITTPTRSKPKKDLHECEIIIIIISKPFFRLNPWSTIYFELFIPKGGAGQHSETNFWRLGLIFMPSSFTLFMCFPCSLVWAYLGFFNIFLRKKVIKRREKCKNWKKNKISLFAISWFGSSSSMLLWEFGIS